MQCMLYCGHSLISTDIFLIKKCSWFENAKYSFLVDNCFLHRSNSTDRRKILSSVGIGHKVSIGQYIENIESGVRQVYIFT